MPPEQADEDDDWVLEDEDDPEFQAILRGNHRLQHNSLQQRTLDGRVAPRQVPQKDQYEEIPVPKKVNLPTHHVMDFENLKTYIYPQFEVRDYQFNIVRRAFYDNLLVALPTTFIASTVMLNFLRWFPNSKIIFMAPLDLGGQQIKACCSITGIPSSKVAILLDKARKNRKEIWESKQVFFTTPKSLRMTWRLALSRPIDLFIYAFVQNIALTATPASDVDGVQEIINNLNISKVEVRTEQSIDTANDIPSAEIEECIELLATGISPVLKVANERGLLDLTDPTKINFFQCNELSRKMTANPSIPEGLKWSNFFILQLLGIVGQCYRRLNIYGSDTSTSILMKSSPIQNQVERKEVYKKLNADFYFSDSITLLLEKALK
ncbi:ATP-dependent DNA helicase MPH1 [Candida viswanathii]|uniref:ATP-dependent DNA helicase n=1 Tax=Candida viswanathii TaxID=5486 RepID=A0A367XTQ6_9ASCO|nr:ATP-dependent DNA helicase MPH1 [Candida viswanathii]